MVAKMSTIFHTLIDKKTDLKTILITGGAGFIGSNLVNNLLADGGYNITCINNFDNCYDPEQKNKILKQRLLTPALNCCRAISVTKNFLRTRLAITSM